MSTPPLCVDPWFLVLNVRSLAVDTLTQEQPGKMNRLKNPQLFSNPKEQGGQRATCWPEFGEIDESRGSWLRATVIPQQKRPQKLRALAGKPWPVIDEVLGAQCRQ